MKENRNSKAVLSDNLGEAQKIFDRHLSTPTNLEDCNKLKKIFESLQESEDKFRNLQDNVPIGLFQTTPDGKINYVNNWFAKILGYKSPKEIFEKNVAELYVNPQQRKEIIQKLNKTGKLNETEILLKRKDESEIWAVISAKSEFDNSNNVLNYDGYIYDISERKRALEKVKKNEEKFKSLFSFFRLMVDNVPDMIWAKDLDRNFIFVNDGICKKLLNARDTDEPIGKNEMYFVERERRKHSDDPQWFTFGKDCLDSDGIVMKNKKPQKFKEFGNVMGEFLFLDVFKAPLWDESGKMIGTVGSARDVTKEMQIVKEKEREEKLKNVVYNISNAVNTTKDLDELFTVIRFELGNLIDTSNLYIALCENGTDNITLPYFVDEKDRFRKFPGKKSLTHYLIENNKPLLLKEKEYLNITRENGLEIFGTPSKVWLGVPLNIKGETIGAIVLQNYKHEDAFTVEDLELIKYVSNQISISIYQKKADDSLRDSEFKLRKIIDTVPHMIFAKDKHGRFILANKTTADVYGLRVDEIEGKIHSDIHKHVDEIEAFKKSDEYVIKNERIKVTAEQKFTDKNGKVRIFQSIKIPLKTGPSQETAVLGVAIDITDQKDTEIELKHAKERAEESDKLKTAFLANMSHEIRTPMNAIIGFSELLNDEDLTKDNRREFVNLINDNSRLLLNLIEDIIDVAKIEAEQIKIVQSTCQVNQILDELGKYYKVELNKYEYKSIEIKVVKEQEDERFAIISDPLRFKQIMNNLIGNAIKFTDKGSVEFGYTIKDKKTIQFYIKDTGIGLPLDKLNVIFERFRQAEESTTKEYGGTGLGLTISRRLIELLGGTIWVESVLHQGSTFYFTLPLKIANGSVKMRHFNLITEKPDWKEKTILVAEDETSNYELVKATLLKTNVKLLWAKNGKEAVAICKNNNAIDLILMDIRMPEMNGYEATENIKEFRPALPVISLTAYAMADDKEKSIEAGCDDYISKPIKPQDLIDKISLYIK